MKSDSADGQGPFAVGISILVGVSKWFLTSLAKLVVLVIFAFGWSLWQVWKILSGLFRKEDDWLFPDPKPQPGIGVIPEYVPPSSIYPTREELFGDYIKNLRKTVHWKDVEPLVKTAKGISDGTMPMSLRCSEATLFRLQKLAHFYGGANFWKTFEDGPWKWSAQYRYGGKDINPGHFFTFNGPGAELELKIYTSDLSGYKMLKIEGSFDNILELTDWRNTIEVCRAMGMTAPATELILELVNATQGGNEVTNAVGYYAYVVGTTG
jgi:hypothetical protein